MRTPCIIVLHICVYYVYSDLGAMRTPCGGDVLHICVHSDVSHETPDVTPCRTSTPMLVVRTCLARTV